MYALDLLAALAMCLVKGIWPPAALVLLGMLAVSGSGALALVGIRQRYGCRSTPTAWGFGALFVVFIAVKMLVTVKTEDPDTVQHMAPYLCAAIQAVVMGATALVPLVVTTMTSRGITPRSASCQVTPDDRP